MDHSEKLNNWLKQGGWMSCEVIGNRLKIVRLPEANDKETICCTEEDILQENYSNSDSVNLFSEEGISGPNEKFVEGTFNFNETSSQGGKRNSTENEIDICSSDAGLFITLKDNYRELEARDNGKTIAFFIVHILSSTVDNRFYRFNGFTYKKVIIFGIITEIFESKMKTIIVDDGTGQLKCHLNDGLNERIKCGDFENNKVSPENLFDEINNILNSKMKELYDSLPTFENLLIGDRVCISGNVSFHNSYFHLFIDKLERHNDVKEHIKFMKRVFYLYENCYYSYR